MNYISLQGLKMPVLGFGTYQLTGDEARRGVSFALDHGYRHIDTAQIYDNEAEVGDGLKASGVVRGDIFLTTKIWQSGFEGGTDAALRSVDESLKKLKTDYVDLLLVHWPFPNFAIASMVEAVLRARDAGKAKAVGVSNFTSAQIAEAQTIAGETLFCNQVEYHPYLSQKPLLAALRKHGMALTAYSPVARGKVFKDKMLADIGERYNKGAGQVALRWLIQQENVAAIPKSATPNNIKANIDIFDFELSAEDMARIHALAAADGRLIDPGFAPDWDK